MNLIIDNREHNLIQLLSHQVEFTVQQLYIGDIQILYNNNPYIIIERKSINDLKASIRDGRYKEQKYRLMEYKSQQQELNSNADYQVKLIYIIEDFVNYNNDVDINGAIINTHIRDNISVITTHNINDTVQYIIELFGRLKKYPDKYISQQQLTDTNYTNVVKAKKKSTYVNSDNIMALQICQIPSISQSMAEKIQEHFGSIINLIQTIQDQDKIYLTDKERRKAKIKLISEIKYTDKRKIGPKIAETLLEYMQLNKA